jgi:hypothetical protein
VVFSEDDPRERIRGSSSESSYAFLWNV